MTTTATMSSAATTAGLLAGCLVAVLGAMLRIRPDPRLRDDPPPPHHRPLARRLPSRRPSPPGADAIAGWCDALARELRAGTSLGAALRTVAPPAGSSLDEVRHRLSRGVGLADALALSARTADEQAALTVLAACADHGGPAAQPLDRLAAMLRRRAADAAERAVPSAQARLSALVMTLLPGAVLVLLLTTSPSVRTVTATPVGGFVVALGLAANGLGWVWMRRIVAGRSR
ncbi:MAG: type II secretion system F family protein [Acidimicrobiia bacterium]